jgi:hypothetical protein
VRGAVEGEVAQLLQGRVLPADVVEPADQHVEVLTTGLGGVPVPRPVLELLGVEVLLAALS